MADPIDEQKEDEVPDEKPAAKPKPTPAPKAEEPEEEKTLEEILAENARLKKATKAANAEALANRLAAKRLKEIEDEAEQKRIDQLSEEEKFKVQLATAKQEAKEANDRAAKAEEARKRLVIDREIEHEAKELGVEDPTMLVPMIRGEGYAGIDFDEDTNKAVGVKAAVTAMVKRFPGLVTGVVRRGGGTPSRGDIVRPGVRNTAPQKSEAEAEAERAAANRARLAAAVKYSM
jgi:hypothetical protein